MKAKIFSCLRKKLEKRKCLPSNIHENVLIYSKLL